MILHDKLWLIKNSFDNRVNELAEKLGISAVTAKILINRDISDIKTAEYFLNPDIQNLYDPYLLKDMDKAVDRIKGAIEKKENIWIYGDYDVDGVTSISILLLYLESIGYKANYYIPDRIDEGYGINFEAIDYIKSMGGDLIISVDCGITSYEEVEYAKSLGIDMIITDHHECQENIPNALAVINPKRRDCSYPFDMLAGVGIAFKLIQALSPSDEFENICRNYLDIVALGTIADVAPIVDENRIITKNGLERLSNTANLGLKALIEICGLSGKKINTGYVGFVLAPRINAVGRIGNASLGVELLLCKDYDKAMSIAKKLHSNNDMRQNIEKKIIMDAEKQIEENIDLVKSKIIVLASEDWHSGVIGIAASKIAEKYYRPTILIGIEEGIGKGSARSFGDINIFDIMNKCKEMFIKFGGHEQAAGLSIEAAKIDEFREKINSIAEQKITSKDLVPNLYIDEELDAKHIGFSVIKEIEKLEPFGIGNPKPQFLYRNLTVEDVSFVGKDKSHLKLIVQDENRIFDCIGFGFGNNNIRLSKGDKIDLVFNLENNNFKGIETIQFNIKDIRIKQGEYYQNKEIIKNYYLTFPNIFDDIKSFQNISDRDNIFDYRNYKNRAKFVFERLSTSGSNIVLVNTLEGLIELVFSFSDMGELEMIKYISFNNAKSKSKNNIVVNPIVKNIDFNNYENIIIFDMAVDMAKLDYIIEYGKNIYVFYNESDIKSITRFLASSIPNRNDLVMVYKYIKRCINNKELTIFDIHSYLNSMNLAKIKLSLKILEDTKLINLEVKNDRYMPKLLSPPDKKINILETNLYRKIVGIRESFNKYKNIMMGNGF